MLIGPHERHAQPAPGNAATLFSAVPAKRRTRFAAGERLVSSELGARDDRPLLASQRPSQVRPLLLLERKNNVPVLLHVHDGPTLGLRFVECLVELPNA
jgi:hypothetical protein